MERAPTRVYESRPGKRGAAVRMLLPGLSLLAAGCVWPQSALAPEGPAAGWIAEQWWVLFVMASAVFALVAATLGYALFRRRAFRGERPPLPLAPNAASQETNRRSRPGDPRIDADDLTVATETAAEDRKAVRWVVAGGVVFPALVLVPLFIYTLVILGRLDARQPTDLTIGVIGWQFWWEAHYFDADGGLAFRTANEIHIPVGRRVRFRLESVDVIHSFWVPRLHGKLDMTPGKTTQFWLQADRPGVFRGQCAEYCGVQHTRMALLVIAQPEPEYEAWFQAQRRPAAPPRDSLAAAGEAVFLNSACVACHRVRGTPAEGWVGPDLTHLASRRTLAAATLPNTRGNLGGWLTDPQGLKPGSRMPAVPLRAEELNALLHYLEGLE
jgi:cytochrome c oxidase subunit II